MSAFVALRKESVDRNFNTVQIKIVKMQSLSARRAWIEIKYRYLTQHPQNVALRKESVDRNDICNPASTLPSVALRKESVDRN